MTDEQLVLINRTPTHWDELAQQSSLITKKSGANITLPAVALGTSDLPSGPDILTLMMLQNGAQMTSSDKTQATFHTAINEFGRGGFPGAQALDFYTSFANPNKPNYSFSTKIGDPVRAFSEGKIAYLIDYASRANEIKLINPSLEFDVEAVPQVKETKNPVNFITYKTYTVPKSSPNQAAAWQLIRFMTTEDNIQNSFDQSRSPITLSRFVIDSDASGQAMSTAQNWYNPDKGATDQIFRATIADVLTGKSAQTALDGAALQVTNLLKILKD